MRRLVGPVLRLHNTHARCHIFRQTKGVRALMWQPTEFLSYYSVKDKLQKLASLGEKLKERIALGLNYEESKLYQQVTPAIYEMVETQSSLESMLFVSCKLYPRMTMPDKVVTFDLLTEKLYHDIADNSHIFTRSPNLRLIQHRLFIEGSLDEAVKPLTQTEKLTELIQSIVTSLDKLNSHQLLSVFSNLQLLNWPMDSSEISQIVQRVQGLDFKQLRIQEVLLYINAYIMYSPDTYRETTIPLVFKWLEINEINWGESDIFDLLQILVTKKYYKNDQQQRKILEKVHTEIKRHVKIEELSLVDSVSLMAFNRLLLMSNFIRKTDSLYREIRQHVQQKVLEMRDEDVYAIHTLVDYSFWMDWKHEFKVLLRQKCLEMLEKDHLKHDVLLFYYLLGCNILEHPETEITKKLHDQFRDVIKHIDLCGMQVRLFTSLPANSGLVVIQKRLRVYANSKNGAEIYCGHILASLPSAEVNMDDATLIRDNFLEAVMRKSNYNEKKSLIRKGLMMCIKFPCMTPTSLEFMEKTNFSGDQKSFRLLPVLQAMKSKAVKYPSFKRMITEANNSRSHVTLCRIQALLVRNICQDYEYRGWVTFFRKPGKHLQDGYYIEPMFQVLCTQKIKELLSTIKFESWKQVFYLYSCSMYDPEQMLYYTCISENNKIPKALLVQLLVEYFSLKPESVKDKKFLEIKSFVQGDKKHVQDDKECVGDDKERQLKTELQIGRKRDRGFIPNIYKKYINLAFKGKAVENWPLNNGQIVDIMVLLDQENKPVLVNQESFDSAEKLGLKKVAFFKGLSKKEHYGTKHRLSYMNAIEDLQNAGFTCVLIWETELHSIAYRDQKDKIKLIQQKVADTNPFRNHAPQLTYDFDKVKDGPFKEYFQFRPMEEDSAQLQP